MSYKPARARYGRYRYARTPLTFLAPTRRDIKEITDELSRNPPKPIEKMSPRQFFDKVALMRQHQRDYYHTRSRDALRASIALEQEIDREIDRVRLILSSK